MPKKELTLFEQDKLKEAIKYDLTPIAISHPLTHQKVTAYKVEKNFNQNILKEIYKRRCRKKHPDNVTIEKYYQGGMAELAFLMALNYPLDIYIKHFNDSLHEDGKGGGDNGTDFICNNAIIDVKCSSLDNRNNFSFSYYYASMKRQSDYFVFVRYEHKSIIEENLTIRTAPIYTLLGYATYEDVKAIWEPKQKAYGERFLVADADLLYKNDKLLTDFNMLKPI